MRRFRQCAECLEEFHSPSNRRFHAEPNACPECGPQIEGREEGLQAAIAALQGGKIVAVKGIGGFHLMVDARDEAAVKRLRLRKEREEKPFALLYPSLASLSGDCEVNDVESALLGSGRHRSFFSPENRVRRAELPRVWRPGAPGSERCCPPTRSIIFYRGRLVSRSSRRAGTARRSRSASTTRRLETGLRESLTHFSFTIGPSRGLSTIPWCGWWTGKSWFFAPAWGYAPMAWEFTECGEEALGLGGHLKSTVALSRGKRLFLSPHIGDLTHPDARDAFAGTVKHFVGLYGEGSVVCDSHPDYASSQFARELTESPARVQHHFAHVMGCLFENGAVPPLSAWPGTARDSGTMARSGAGSFFGWEKRVFSESLVSGHSPFPGAKPPRASRLESP